MSGEEETQVEVTVDVPSGESEESSPTVVVVEDSQETDTTAPVVVETAIDHEGRLTTIEMMLATQAETLELIAQSLAVQAQADALLQEEIEEVAAVAAEAAEEAQAPAEQDEQPTREHPFFRPWGNK